MKYSTMTVLFLARSRKDWRRGGSSFTSILKAGRVIQGRPVDPFLRLCETLTRNGFDTDESGSGFVAQSVQVWHHMI